MILSDKLFFKTAEDTGNERHVTQISSTETREKEDVSMRYQSGEDDVRKGWMDEKITGDGEGDGNITVA